MLNKEGLRELAYIVTIDDIRPIEGKDRVECAVINGWTIMVRKGQFKPGDPGIYFEIDSKTPETEPFEFLAAKHYKIKTQKYGLKDANGNKVGQFWSQGLLMSADDFGWIAGSNYIEDSDGIQHIAGDEDSMFMTKQLGVTYADPEDNKRKANSSGDKYKKMAQRHPKVFQNRFVKWLYKRNWGKKLLFVFFGKAKDKRNWLSWVVKTDEERIENIPFMLQNKDPWIATEKIDGSSTTFTIHRGKHPWSKNEFYVCSRNVVFDTPEKADRCYYDSNIYLEMAEKYHMRDVLEDMMQKYPEEQWITIQGETYGDGVQRRDYSKKNGERDLAVFNLIFSTCGRINSLEMVGEMARYDIPCVPIVEEEYVLPDTIEELREFVNSQKSKIDGEMREGIVFRSQDGSKSFKCVSPEFLVKYHG